MEAATLQNLRRMMLQVDALYLMCDRLDSWLLGLWLGRVVMSEAEVRDGHEGLSRCCCSGSIQI